MTNEWFAIRTKSNREYCVSEALTGKGYDVLFPRYAVANKSGDTHKPKAAPIRPLFPGYLFCRFDAKFRLPVLTVPGVLNVVSNGRIPIPLDDREVESVKVLVSSRLPVFPHSYLKQGDMIKISSGPLAGAEGCIVDANQRRLVVSITLLQRALAVEVEPEWLDSHYSKSAQAADHGALRTFRDLSLQARELN